MRPLSLFPCSCLIAVFCLGLPWGALGQDRFALVIGNANYESNLWLRNPGQDADALEKALQPLGFTVLKRKDLDLAEMEDVLAEFRKRLTGRSVAVFFFAGHGLEVQGENYLVPLRASIREEYEVKRKCLPVGQVLDALRESESYLNAVILDCCRDNPLKRSWTRSTSRQGLAAITEIPQGTLIAFSTASGAVAADGREGNSPFTHHLCAVLQSRPSQGLELVDVFREASRNLKQATNQVPWLNMEASLEKFYLWRPTPSVPDPG